MSVPICYLNQCCNVVNSDLRNKLRWNLKRNSYIFRKENAFENVVCEMAAILSLLLYITSILKYSVRYSYINQPKWTRLFLPYSLGLPHWQKYGCCSAVEVTLGDMACWRHQMETFSTLRALCEGNPSATGGFPSQRPVTRSFDIFFDLRLNNRLSKQLRRRWFVTPSRSLWRHNDQQWIEVFNIMINLF